MTKLNITGLDKSEVLAALYNGARFQDAEHFYDTAPQTADWAENFTCGMLDFTHGLVQGKNLCIDLSDDVIDVSAYDKLHGSGKAEKVL